MNPEHSHIQHRHASPQQAIRIHINSMGSYLASFDDTMRQGDRWVLREYSYIRAREKGVDANLRYKSATWMQCICWRCRGATQSPYILNGNLSSGIRSIAVRQNPLAADPARPGCTSESCYATTSRDLRNWEMDSSLSVLMRPRE